MTISLNPEARVRLDAHLDAVERALIASGHSRESRRGIVDDLEAQILDMLAAKSQNPALEDVEAVLGTLDPPAAYGENAPPAEAEKASSPENKSTPGAAGIPKANKWRNPFIHLSAKIYQYPFLCWLAGVGVMWLWHVPAIYNQLFVMHGAMTAVHHMNVLSYIHMLSLLIAGMLFCLPVINPYSTYRLTPLFGVLYLTSACVGCSLLGLFITFAPAGTFTHYISMNANDSMLSLIRNNWNISAAADQQAGGLIMWVPCCFIYLSAAMVLLLKWFDTRNEVSSIINTVHALK